MTTIPNLSGVASSEDVSSIKAGGFSKDYINWARVMHYIRENAPDWLPYFERNGEGGIELKAPDGSHYILVGFQNVETGLRLPSIPHGQDLGKNPSGRDISDAGMRGVCKAAALQLGLAWSLWSKDDPMERERESVNPEEEFDEMAFVAEVSAYTTLESLNKFLKKNSSVLRKLPEDKQQTLRDAVHKRRELINTQE